MPEKLGAGDPEGSVQLKRKLEAPSFPSVKSTPSLTKYLFVLTSEVAAFEKIGSAKRAVARAHGMNFRLIFLIIMDLFENDYSRLRVIYPKEKHVLN